MKKTKEKILDTAHKLFNKQGVPTVSIRQIAKEAQISHGNLIYHYRDKEEITAALNQRLLDEAKRLNTGIDRENFDIRSLYQVTLSGFNVVYEYRFFLIDLNYIMKSDKQLHKTFLEVEKLRAQMYAEVIQLSIDKGLMRKAEFSSEYPDLIKRIRIFSDHWVASSLIYDKQKKSELIQNYARLFMGFFYPYLTGNGKN